MFSLDFISFLLSGLSRISGFWVHGEQQIGTEMPEQGLLLSANAGCLKRI